MNSDPSGYSTENDLQFYQQAWLTIDEAVEYETRLICNMHNEVSYDSQVMQIGKEIIHQLRNTGLEYALTYVLEPYVGPDYSKLIANGIVSGLDIACSSKDKIINYEIFSIRTSASLSNSVNPRDYLEDALNMQNLHEAPIRFKHKWSENGYDYEVRIHEAETQYGKSGSIFRVARRSQAIDANGQGFGWEYLSIDGNWYHTSVLKPNNPNYNPRAAADTHIQL